MNISDLISEEIDPQRKSLQETIRRIVVMLDDAIDDADYLSEFPPENGTYSGSSYGILHKELMKTKGQLEERLSWLKKERIGR